jgi:hypothetical protein
LAQTWTHLRILVTDNASDPEIATDVREFIEKLGDPRISYVLNPVPDGERGQTLYNFEQCDAPYFMLLHDDDQLHPTVVARAVEVMEADPALAFFATSQNLINDEGTLMHEDSATYNRWLGRDKLGTGRVDNVLVVSLRGGAFSMSGTMFRQQTMARVGFVDPEGGGFPIDMIPYLRIGEAGEPGYFANEPLSDYRMHAGQSRVKHANWTFNQWMIEKYTAQLETRQFTGEAERLRRYLLGLGLCRLAIVRHVGHQAGEARHLLRRAVRLSPSTWQCWAWCAVVHLLPFIIRPRWGHRVTLASWTPEV